MTNYKVTFFFEGFQASQSVGSGSAVGWTETWYQTSNLPIAQFARDISIGAYRLMRVRFLFNIYQLSRVRIADDQNPRNVKLVDIPSIAGRLLPTASASPAQVTCAALVDFVTTPVADGNVAHHRRMLFRGLSTGMMDGNVIHQNSDSFVAFRDFLTYLTTGVVPPSILPPDVVGRTPVWAIRYIPQSLQRWPLASLVVDPRNSHQVIIQLGQIQPPVGPPNPPPDVGTGQRWLLRGVKFPYHVNRLWTATGILTGTTPTSTILGRSRFTLSGEWTNSGTATLWQPAYSPASQYHIIGLRSRDTGRPSVRTRGRRNPVT